MNLPNKLTVFRIILVPFFVAVLLWPFPHHYLAAFVLFAGASYTDHLDGKIARRDGLITNFGKFLDPLADKILVISALVCFVQLGLINTWFVLLIIAREFMVTSIRLVAVDGGVVIAANNWGKAKTVSQIAAICLVLLFQYAGELMMAGGGPTFAVWGMDGLTALNAAGQVFLFAVTALTVISGGIYLKQNWNVVKSAK